MVKISQCSGDRIPPMYSFDERLNMLKRVLPLCSPWHIASDAITFLGEGSYGAVYNVVLQRGRGKSVQVALKIMEIGEKNKNKALVEESVVEILNGRRMSKANIGPKIYDEFFYTEDKCLCSRQKPREFVFIIMEKFQGSVSQFLWSEPSMSKKWDKYATLKSKGIAIRKMMSLTKRMIGKNLYCWDIKPGNFVINAYGTTAKKIKVKMIDFGGQFCKFGIEQREIYIGMLRELAKINFWSLGGRSSIRSRQWLLNIGASEFDEIFYHLVMIPFIWMIAHIEYKDGAMMVNLKSEIRKVAHTILLNLCHSTEIRDGCLSLLRVEPVIFKTFAHYTGGGFDLEPTTANIRQHLGFVLSELCFELLDIPKQVPKAVAKKRKKWDEQSIPSESVTIGGRRRHKTRKRR
jgi:hypothetical protein